MNLSSFVIFIFIGFVSFTNRCFSQDSLVMKAFLNGKVKILVPKNYSELSQAKIVERFPDLKTRPSVILTDIEEFSSIKIILLQDELNENEVVAYKDFRLKLMRKQTNVELLGDGVKEINGKMVGLIKNLYTDKNTFAYFFFTSMDGKLLVLTYNCVDKLWPALEGIVEKIVNSLKVE